METMTASTKNSSISFNTVPLTSVQLNDLARLLDSFGRGASQPLLLSSQPGTSARPAAAVIPFEDYLRLMRYDNEAERDFQDLVRARAETPRDQMISFDDLLAELDTDTEAES